MRRSNEMVPVGPPIVHPRYWWELAARKALDSWGGGTERSVAAAFEESYRDGIAFAAKFIEAKGQQELARMVKAAAEDAASVIPGKN